MRRRHWLNLLLATSVVTLLAIIYFLARRAGPLPKPEIPLSPHIPKKLRSKPISKRTENLHSYVHKTKIDIPQATNRPRGPLTIFPDGTIMARISTEEKKQKADLNAALIKLKRDFKQATTPKVNHLITTTIDEAILKHGITEDDLQPYAEEINERVNNLIEACSELNGAYTLGAGTCGSYATSIAVQSACEAAPEDTETLAINLFGEKPELKHAIVVEGKLPKGVTFFQPARYAGKVTIIDAWSDGDGIYHNTLPDILDKIQSWKSSQTFPLSFPKLENMNPTLKSVLCELYRDIVKLLIHYFSETARSKFDAHCHLETLAHHLTEAGCRR